MKVFYERKDRQIFICQNIDLNFFLHFHKELEFIFCIEGELVTTYNNRTYVLHKNDFMLMLPNCVHSYRTHDFSRIICCVVPLEFIPVFKSYWSMQAENPFVHADKQVSEWCIQMLEEKNIRNNEYLIVGYIHMILGSVLPLLEFSARDTKTDDDVLPMVLQYLEDNFRERITLGQMAHHFGLNASYLSRVFSGGIGCTLTQYIHDMRIAYAKHLLHEKDLNITQIAYECGFSTQRTFNRVFSKIEKCSPSDYVKKLAKSNPKTTAHIL